MLQRSKTRLLGLLIILVAFAIAIANSLSITQFQVSDTDPMTYVIVVMLMSLLFIMFYMKDDKLQITLRKSDLAIASAVFVAYFILLSYSRVALSFIYMSYRVDAFLSVFALASIIIAVFGTQGLKRMKFLLFYVMFSSPLLLIPITNLDASFTLLNAGVVFNTLRLAGVQVAQAGVKIMGASAGTISIASTCADIGAFIALLMFLLPLAYLYEGKPGRKAAWVMCGAALMFLLNILRMFSIALIWAFYGIGTAISTIHLFLGQIIFYATIIAMMLIAYRFGMSIPKAHAHNRRVSERHKARHESIRPSAYRIPASLALAFGVIAFAVSLPYSGSIRASAYAFNSNATVNYASLGEGVLSILANSKQNITELSLIGSDYAFSLGSSKNTSNLTYVIVNYTRYPASGAPNIAYAKVLRSSAILFNNGITLHTGAVISENHTFIINYFSVPYYTNGTEVTVRYELYKLVNSTNAAQCSAYGQRSIGAIASIQSDIYNALHLRGTSYQDMFCSSYRILSSVKA
ncbi:MAG: exosortase/archaeosortase family protein [Candidatus Marsarchaeota archaeon]|nr:exosortase/archaeosortase family protein [Candidatus Marsarchaeota archaeon]